MSSGTSVVDNDIYNLMDYGSDPIGSFYVFMYYKCSKQIMYIWKKQKHCGVK